MSPHSEGTSPSEVTTPPPLLPTRTGVRLLERPNWKKGRRRRLVYTMDKKCKTVGCLSQLNRDGLNGRIRHAVFVLIKRTCVPKKNYRNGPIFKYLVEVFLLCLDIFSYNIYIGRSVRRRTGLRNVKGFRYGWFMDFGIWCHNCKQYVPVSWLHIISVSPSNNRSKNV